MIDAISPTGGPYGGASEEPNNQTIGKRPIDCLIDLVMHARIEMLRALSASDPTP
jgi:hypothetical protein